MDPENEAFALGTVDGQVKLSDITINFPARRYKPFSLLQAIGNTGIESY